MKDSRSKGNLNDNVKVRVPGDYPWKILGELAKDTAIVLNGEDSTKICDIVRLRDMQALDDLTEEWGPHSIASADISPSTFFAKYQLSSLLKKFQFDTDATMRRTAALKKFRDAEAACLSFNRYGSKELAFLTNAEDLAVLTYAKQFLSSLLGESLPNWDRLTLWSRHGPGSNLDTQKGLVSSYHKYENWPYSVTRGALGLARDAIQSDERWLGALEDSYRRKNGIEPWRILDQETFWSNVLHVVPGNRICFVPKNARTDRSIAIEPCMNLYLQLGVDGYIRRRLRRWGVDLDSQEKNQKLARDGSINWMTENPFVTLDLAAASDSISLELCYRLLPPQWYTYLIRLRSPVGVCEGEIFEFEKISSMGNGYTFALESAIFAAICFAVQKVIEGSHNKDEIAVYGDDIIVRRSLSLLVIRTLNLYGFSLNHEKSFVSGPFRESCGADWFKGTPCRPVFLTSSPSTVMELWSDQNRLRRILSLRFMGFEFKSTSIIDKWIPRSFDSFVGPYSDEEFDSYKHVPLPTVRYRNGLWKFKRIIVTMKHLKGESFLFRKLMHPLRPTPEPITHSKLLWGGCKVQGAGSRFAVTARKGLTVSYTFSPVSYWQDEYNDLFA